MFNIKKAIPIFLIMFIFTGCGVLEFYLHPQQGKFSRTPIELEDLTLKVGESKTAIEQSDCISLVGGYYPSVISDNIDVVQVVNQKIMCGHEVIVVAKQEGIANLCYTSNYNLGEQDKSYSVKECRNDNKFKVIVTK